MHAIGWRTLGQQADCCPGKLLLWQDPGLGMALLPAHQVQKGHGTTEEGDPRIMAHVPQPFPGTLGVFRPDAGQWHRPKLTQQGLETCHVAQSGMHAQQLACSPIDEQLLGEGLGLARSPFLEGGLQEGNGFGEGALAVGGQTEIGEHGETIGGVGMGRQEGLEGGKVGSRSRGLTCQEILKGPCIFCRDRACGDEGLREAGDRDGCWGRGGPGPKPWHQAGQQQQEMPGLRPGRHGTSPRKALSRGA